MGYKAENLYRRSRASLPRQEVTQNVADRDEQAVELTYTGGSVLSHGGRSVAMAGLALLNRNSAVRKGLLPRKK